MSHRDPRKPPPMDRTHPLPPVRWLLGPDLVANLQKMALYTLSAGKLDLRDWMKGSVLDEFAAYGGDEFWFDYLSDTGDSQLAMYALARLCLTDVVLDHVPEDLSSRVPRTSVPRLLPRGQFLFCGGDTAYHVADKQTLQQRFCEPFRLAAEDTGADELERRPLLGIPGNHDYYDQLDGFNRQFRVPLQRREAASDEADEVPLDVPGFRRVQEASYVAVALPFGYWLFGLDTEQDKLDARQRAFFREILEERAPGPHKLIVATPAPMIVHGKRPHRDDAAVRPLLALAALAPPFVPGARPAGSDKNRREANENARKVPTREELEQQAQELSPGECRLYLSGDTHHYARYFGEPSAGQPACCAAVVSGIGGAFLHPTHHDFGQVSIHRRYPSAAQSRAAMAAALFRPWVLLNGGYVAIFGAALAIASYCASALVQPYWTVLEALVRALPNVEAGGDSSSDSELLFRAVSRVGGVLLVVLLLGLSIGAMFRGARRQRRRAIGATEAATEAATEGASEVVPPPEKAGFNGLIGVGWGLLGLTVAVVLGLSFIERDLWVPFSAMAVAAVLLGAGVWQSNRMIRMGETRLRAAALTLSCALAGSALTAACFSIVKCPASELRCAQSAQSMVFDFSMGFLLLFTLVGIAVGLPLLGAAIHRKTRHKLGFVGLGLWNFGLVLAVPLVLLRTLHLDAKTAVGLGIFALSTVLFAVAGQRVFARETGRRWLVLLWLLLGVVWLLAPLASGARALNQPEGVAVHAALLAIAAGLGALVAGTSFGWYFAVADTFRGHANEVGGAALVEHYKQLIRFRVTRDGITGFVIAIDHPSMAESAEGSRPRLVDVFELRPKA